MGPHPSGNMTIRRGIQTTFKLPTVHWTAMKPNDTKDTIWYLMDDSKVIKDLDLASFEGTFKLAHQEPFGRKKSNKNLVNGGGDENDANTAAKKQLDSLMEHTRLKNISICRRRLPDMPIPDLVRAINALDLKTLSVDTVEVLQRMVPLDQEIKAFREYNTAGKDVELLTEEDKLMRQFSCVERFGTKLQIMSFMAAFKDNVAAVRPQVNSVTMASKSVKSSKKLKRVLELILAFGNYMNSQKKGPCYGFRLQSLDSLTITKSTDKKQHIVHYIASVVEQKYPELKNFYSELTFLDKASQFSLENIMTDVVELERGMELTRRELENRLKAPNAQERDKVSQNAALKDFADAAGDQLRSLRTEANRCKALYEECVEFYGESAKTVDANTFFGYLVRFVGTWKTSEAENEKRRQMAAAAQRAAAQKTQVAEAAELKRKNDANLRKDMQTQLVDVLRTRNNKTPMSHIRTAEIQDGTFEEIILDMKKKPFRAEQNGGPAGTEHMRKSFRRQRSENRNSMQLHYVTSESEAL